MQQLIIARWRGYSGKFWRIKDIIPGTSRFWSLCRIMVLVAEVFRRNRSAGWTFRAEEIERIMSKEGLALPDSIAPIIP